MTYYMDTNSDRWSIVEPTTRWATAPHQYIKELIEKNSIHEINATDEFNTQFQEVLKNVRGKRLVCGLTFIVLLCWGKGSVKQKQIVNGAKYFRQTRWKCLIY